MANLFNFDTEANSNTGLKGNTIHDVIFQGVESKSVGTETVYKVLELKFEKPGVGFHKQTIFAPKTKADTERKEGKFGPSPSSLEQSMETIKQLIAAVNPTFYELLKAKDAKAVAQWNPANWDQMCNMLAKLVTPCIGNKLQIKLIENAKGDSQFPGFPLAINGSTGGVYVTTISMGKELSFTKKEKEKIANATVATPSRMPEANAFEMPNLADEDMPQANANAALPANDNDLPF